MNREAQSYEPLTSENAALVLVDHQVGLMTGVRDYSTGELKHNVVALAKAAKARQHVGSDLSRAGRGAARCTDHRPGLRQCLGRCARGSRHRGDWPQEADLRGHLSDRKSTRLNSSHGYISYAVFCLKKKNKNIVCTKSSR